LTTPSLLSRGAHSSHFVGDARKIRNLGHPPEKVNSRFLTGPSARFGITEVDLGSLYAALKRRSSTTASLRSADSCSATLRMTVLRGGAVLLLGGHFFRDGLAKIIQRHAQAGFQLNLWFPA